jgi:uncharacterized protein YggU (UPF0235/DUF167 family)
VTTEDFVRPTQGGAYVKILVSPGSKSTALKGSYGKEALRLSVAAPPVGGRANTEAERYLATLIGVEKTRVAVVKGASSRDKLLFVEGAKPEEVREGLVNLVR